VPRPKSDLTKSGRAIGVRLTEWEFKEWVKLGGYRWLRQQLMDSKRKSVKDVQKPEAS
jgi:hypothetical protein